VKQILLLAALPGLLLAQALEGTWQGTLAPNPNREIRMVFRITKDGSTYQGMLFNLAANRQANLGAITLQKRIKSDGILNFSYRYRRNPGSTLAQKTPLLEQYDASIVYPVSDRWRLIGHWTYSVLDKKTVEALAGVEHDSCCVALRLVARHYVNTYDTTTALGSANTAIMFEVEFKGMGGFTGQSENAIRNGILGYQ